MRTGMKWGACGNRPGSNSSINQIKQCLGCDVQGGGPSCTGETLARNIWKKGLYEKIFNARSIRAYSILRARPIIRTSEIHCLEEETISRIIPLRHCNVLLREGHRTRFLAANGNNICTLQSYPNSTIASSIRLGGLLQCEVRSVQKDISEFCKVIDCHTPREAIKKKFDQLCPTRRYQVSSLFILYIVK